MMTEPGEVEQPGGRRSATGRHPADGTGRGPAYDAGVSDDAGNDPFGGNNPFQGLPIFGDLAKMFQNQGAMSWDAARQFALSIATGGEPEGNVDPLERIKIEQLARVAELQIANATGLDPAPGGQGITITPVNRTTWTQHTLDAYRPLFEILATSLNENEANQPSEDLVDPADPMGFMAPLMKMIGPMMLGLTAGSMVGHLAQRSFGQYDLPIPRPPGDHLQLLIANLDEFGARVEPARRTTCACGSASTRSPTTPSSTCRTSGPGSISSSPTTCRASSPTPAGSSRSSAASRAWTSPARTPSRT